MEMEFARHELCYDRILSVLTPDRKKIKERILIGEELQMRFRLQGDMDADMLCDTTRPLGTFLAEFEHDSDGEWNRLEEMLIAFEMFKKEALQRKKAVKERTARPKEFTDWTLLFGGIQSVISAGCTLNIR